MDDFKNIFIGMILGISNIIPGVSAGTMAVVLGIYDKLISSISEIFKNFKSNFRFLFFIGIGIFLGVVIFSGILNILLDKYPWYMSYLFIGLIAGSMRTLFKVIRSYEVKKIHYLYLIVTFVILLCVKFMTPTMDVKIIVTLNFENIILLFLSGFIASSTMILPGVSGSFILILFGMYNSVISAVSNFNVLFLIPFCIGVFLGIVVMINAVGYFLKNFPVQSYMSIIGLILGSMISIIPGFEFSMRGIVYVVIFVIGFLISSSTWIADRTI